MDNNGSCVTCICVCYLPPANSSRGDKSTEFFDCLKAQIMEFHSYGKFFICGDFNARIGSLPDIRDSELLTNHREHIDKSVSSHGKALLTSDMCVLNGRSGPEGNQYTSISVRGMAVVDYCLVPHEDFKNYQDFTIISMPEMMEKQCLQVDATLSDHSVLSWCLKIAFSIANPVTKDILKW